MTVVSPPKLNLNTRLLEQRERISNPSCHELKRVLVFVKDLPPANGI